MWWRRSISAAVERMSWRSIAASVCSSTSGNWMPWFCRQLLAPGGAPVGVGDGFVDAELRGAERRRRLADAVLVHEVLGQLEAVVEAAEHRVGADPHVGQRDLGVVGRHVERPPEEVDAEPGRVGRHEEGGDADRRAGVARRAGEDDVVGGVVQPGVEALRGR